MCVLLLQARLTLCKPMGCSSPGSSVHGIFQARILEWVVISFSRGSPDPGSEPRSPALQADSLLSEPPGNLMCNEKSSQWVLGLARWALVEEELELNVEGSLT